MTAGYTPPGVQVVSIPNNRIINVTDTQQVPAIVGPGAVVRQVTDEVLVRTSGSGTHAITGHLFQDNLANYNVTITKISAYPNASGSYGTWDGNHAWRPGTGTANPANIVWMSGSPGSGQPRYGEFYYASYWYPIPASQFEPKLFLDSKEVAATYGVEDPPLNSPITTAANIAFENGAKAVICVQISGSQDSTSVWTNALNKLKKRTDVSYIVPVSPSSSIQSTVLTHALTESAAAIGHECRGVFGPEQGTTVDAFLARASALNNSRAVLVAPASSIFRRTAAGNTLSLDGSYAAAAVAGLINSQEHPRDPITGATIVGFTIADDYYEPFDMNRMANVGITVLYSQAGVIKVRHGQTTNTASADTVEISVVDAADFVARITRSNLHNIFIGKGVVIDEGTPARVESATRSLWTSLIKSGDISKFGTKNDPTTGEVAITAQQDTSEPRRINVTGAVSFLYPLNWINVSFYFYV